MLLISFCLNHRLTFNTFDQILTEQQVYSISTSPSDTDNDFDNYKVILLHSQLWCPRPCATKQSPFVTGFRKLGVFHSSLLHRRAFWMLKIHFNISQKLFWDRFWALWKIWMFICLNNKHIFHLQIQIHFLNCGPSWSEPTENVSNLPTSHD